MGIRCTASVWKGGFEGGNLVAWKRIPNHSAGACFSGGGSAGGMVKGPTSLASSTGSKWPALVPWSSLPTNNPAGSEDLPHNRVRNCDAPNYH
jgi:hypothetical protein